MSFTSDFLSETAMIATRLDRAAIEACVGELVALRERSGRLFILGVGGSAANASHAVNDFRKLCGIEAYAPTDNVAEVTARTNDDGWNTVFREWLIGSNLGPNDALLILSVGGGDAARNVSTGLMLAVNLAIKCGARVVGIVGRDRGYVATHANVCVIIPTVNAERITPHAESFQAVVWHLLVSHPDLKRNSTKW